MQKISSKFKLFVFFLLLALGSQTALAKKMYRWEDENGKVHFTGQMPPDKVKYGSKVLDEDARVVEVKEGAKTKAQREKEQRLAILRKEQEKLIAKQMAHDKVLLTTFRNVKDIELALASKKEALAAQRRVLDGNLQRLQEQLTSQQQTAARFERNGRKASKKLLDEIEASKKQIGLANAEIEKYLNKMMELEREFASDIERFKFLTEKGETKVAAVPAEKEPEPDSLGIFVCLSIEQCDKAWNAVRTYVQRHATTKIDVDTDSLIMTRKVQTDKDLSLSASKMSLNGKIPEIFLDIQCHQSISGQELCASEKVAAIRTGFKAYISEQLQPAE